MVRAGAPPARLAAPPWIRPASRLDHTLTLSGAAGRRAAVAFWNGAPADEGVWVRVTVGEHAHTNFEIGSPLPPLLHPKVLCDA